MITATFIIYLLAMIALGYMAFKRTQNNADYFLGGRSLGPVTSALSAGASDMSGWLLMGLPAYAFSSGMESVWLSAGLLMGTYCNWLFVAARLRVYTQVSGDSLTIPSYLENRFGGNNKPLRVISALFILLFFLFYTASGLVAGGKLFASTFGFDYQVAVIIGSFAVIAYTLFGGFLAVAWTDVVQGLLMLLALILVPVLAFDNTFVAVETKNPNLLNMMTDASGKPLTWIAIVSLVAWGLGYFGQPHILARFMAIKSNKEVATARRIATSWTFITLMGACFVGFAGIHTFPTGLPDGEKIFIAMVNVLFHPLIAGVLLAAILAAIMSTADSQLLVSSSALAEDIYKGVINKNASPESLVNIGRYCVFGVSIVATLIALDENSSVLALVSYAWAGFGAAFGPVIVLSLFNKNMTSLSATAGVVVGGLTVIIWKQLSGGIFDLYEIVPGMILSTIVILAITKFSKQSDAKVLKEFDVYESKL